MSAEEAKQPKAYDHFPAPVPTTIPLFGDLFIVVKQRLTVGEERRARKRMYLPNYQTGQLLVDPTMSGLTTVIAYLLDWNLTRGGQRVEIRDLALAAEKDDAKVLEMQAILEQLDPATYDAIEAAVKKHEAEQDAERAAAKKSQGGDKSETSTSSSPSAPAGASNTSEHSTETTTTRP
jgi:hypothetical protein